MLPRTLLRPPEAQICLQSNVNTTEGSIAVPNVNRNGRQSKIIITDYNFEKYALLYSTAEVLTYGIMVWMFQFCTFKKGKQANLRSKCTNWSHLQHLWLLEFHKYHH
jgi:hypothetical protein